MELSQQGGATQKRLGTTALDSRVAVNSSSLATSSAYPMLSGALAFSLVLA